MNPAPSTNSGVTVPYINARLEQTRLVSEHINAEAEIRQSPNEPKPVQIRTETASSFAVGLNHPTTPSAFQVTVEYSAVFKLEGTDVKIADYKGTHCAEFKIVSWGGFDDWPQVVQSAMVPYFAMSHNVALRRAQRTLLDMGLGSVVLPILTDFEPMTQAEKDKPVEASAKN